VSFFSKPKSMPFVVIRNVLGEEMDRIDGVWDLVNADLRRRQWPHANLSGLSLDGANCEGINLFGARLESTSFCRANLQKPSFLSVTRREPISATQTWKAA
jgi:Pentapeptide repeats (8 copies)